MEIRSASVVNWNTATLEAVTDLGARRIERIDPLSQSTLREREAAPASFIDEARSPQGLLTREVLSIQRSDGSTVLSVYA